MNYNKLKLAVSAGARGIATNKKLQGSTFCTFKNDDVSTMQELSYNQAEMILLFLSDCISEKGIDIDTLTNRIETIDKYEIRRNV